MIDSASQIRNAPEIDCRSANFPPLSPGGTLTASTPATITFSLSMPCPLGVNGSDSNHYLYITGGTGTAEAVLITGGTALSGGITGTMTFTPANNHSGAWTIQSASSGIQEAAIAGGSGAVIVVPVSGAPWPVYAPVTFLAGQFVIAYGATIERDFSGAGNVFNFTGSGSPYGGCLGARFTVGGSFTEPTNSYKVYALGITYFNIQDCTFSGGWGNMFLDHIARGSMSNIGADNFSGDCIRLGSQANGGTGVTASNITTSDGTGTGTALHMIDALINLANFDFQGVGGGANTSKGIYFDAPVGCTADESVFSNGIIDSMANAVQANPSTNRFFNVIFNGIYINTSSGGQSFDLPSNSESIHLENVICYGGGGGSGAIVFRGGSELTLENITIINQTGTTPYGFGFIGNITNCQMVDCRCGFNADGTANGTVVGGIYFAAATYTGVTVDGGQVPASNGIHIVTPTSGIAIRNVKGWNPVGPSSISVTSSPFTYTAGNSQEVVYITGGTVSLIKRGSTTVATATGIAVTLPPNGSVQVTYSVTPTMVTDVQ